MQAAAHDQGPSPEELPCDGGTELPALALRRADGNIRTLHEIECDIIRLALRLYPDHLTEVARRLGIGRSTLYRKLDMFGIPTNINAPRPDER